MFFFLFFFFFDCDRSRKKTNDPACTLIIGLLCRRSHKRTPKRLVAVLILFIQLSIIIMKTNKQLICQLQLELQIEAEYRHIHTHTLKIV